jgi:predicted aspartyl protease
MKHRVVYAGVVSALLACAVGPAIAADDAAAVFAKHKAYVGWQDGDGTVSSLRESGAVTLDGRVRSTLTALHRGALFHRSQTSSAGRYDDGFTGRVLWTSNSNGFTVQTVGEPARYVFTRSAVFDERIAGMPASVVRNETIDGTPVTWIRLQPDLGVPAEVAVAESGAFKRVVLDPGGKYETRLDVLGYTDVGGGKRVLSSWRYAGGKAVYAYTSVQANVPVSDAELHPPAQTATWTFDPQNATVPIELTEYRILLDATVNGVKGTFILDTGASGIAFTDTFARRAGARRVGGTMIGGIGGTAEANVYRVDSIAFGANVLHNVDIVTGLDESRSEEREIAGLIGFDLLAGAVVEMNLDDKTLRIMDAAKVAPDTSKGYVARVDLETGTPRIGMTIGGRVPVLATLDSGNPLHVLFSDELLSRDRVSFFSTPGSLSNVVRYYGVNGSETARCGRLQSLELGPIVYRPVPACASPSFSHNDVLVGLDFIKAFNIVFDYPDGYLLMMPRKNAQ